MNLKEAYNYGLYFLSANGVDEADFKSLCLVCSLAGIKNSQFELHLDDEIIMKRFADMLWRVKAGEPLQYVIGKWDFYESEFYVGDGVLIPRPETEELTDLAVKTAEKYVSPVVIDLCSGSGCIGISVALKNPDAQVYCVEKSDKALAYLVKNKDNLHAGNVKIIKGDITDNIDVPNADIIVSNPPYIKSDEIKSLQKEVLFEPVMALDGGSDGLDFYRIINDKWTDKLNSNGTLLLEIGEEQGNSIKNILTDFKQRRVIKDMYGNDRIICAEK